MRSFWALLLGVVSPLVAVVVVVVFASRPLPALAQSDLFELVPVSFVAFEELEHEGFGTAGYMNCTIASAGVAECLSATGQHDGGLGVLTLAPPGEEYMVHGLKVTYITLSSMGDRWKLHGAGTGVAVGNNVLMQASSVIYLPPAATNSDIFFYAPDNSVGLPGSAPPAWGSVYDDVFHRPQSGLDLTTESYLRVRRDPDSVSALPEEHVAIGVYWIVEVTPPTPTPIPPTPTPSPPDYIGPGLLCTYTTTEGITETISANILRNGSFEDGMLDWSLLQKDSAGDWVPGGSWLILDGDPAYAVDGDAALYKPDYSDEEPGQMTMLYQRRVLLRSGKLVLGASFKATGADNFDTFRTVGYHHTVFGWPNLNPAYMHTFFPENINFDYPHDPWIVYEEHVPVTANLHTMGVFAYSGQVSVVYDGVYAYAYKLVGGQFELICPHEENPEIGEPPEEGTPTPVPGVATPLPTVVLPTAGPLPTLEPPIGLTPLPTSCIGWQEFEVDFGGIDTIPQAELCIAPQSLAVQDDGFLSGSNFSIWGYALPIMGMVAVSMVFMMVRNR